MSDDFGFYGPENDESIATDIRGVTDTVSKFVYTNLSYPCICLKEDIKLPKHKWVVISKLVKHGVQNKNISVYLARGGSLFKAGALSGVQIKAFIDIIGINNLVGYYEKDRKLVGDRLYVLSA